MSAQKHPAAAIAAAEPSTDSPTDHQSLGPVLVLSCRSAGSNRGSSISETSETVGSGSSSEEYDRLNFKRRLSAPLGIFVHFDLCIWIRFQSNPSVLSNYCRYRYSDINKLPLNDQPEGSALTWGNFSKSHFRKQTLSLEQFRRRSCQIHISAAC